jgi:hypothetical protein
MGVFMTQKYRRSVSISKAAYDKLSAHCKGEGISMSGVVQQLVDDFIKAQSRALQGLPPEPEPEPESEKKPEKPKSPISGGGIFSF